MEVSSHPTELLSLVAAGAATETETALVRAHLDDCVVCREEMREWHDVAEAARTLPPPDVAEPPDTTTLSAAPPSTAETGRPVFSALAHLTTPNTDRYRDILKVFTEERSRYLIHLRPEDIADALGRDRDTVVEDLDRLYDWGNLRRLPDTERVTTAEDFNRRRNLYALTRAGEAAERAIGTFLDELDRRAELRTVALADITEGLDALILALDAATHDVGRIRLILRDLTQVFESLADNAAAFMSGLARTIDAATDTDAFLAYKDRLLYYLQRFVTDLVGRSNAIAGQLELIGDIGPVARRLAEVEAVDAAPDLDETARAADITRRAAEWEDRWEGLRAWFLGTERARPQAMLLRRRALTSIRELLAAAAALNERRSGRRDRVADFLALARWFADAPTDADRHVLWRAAFGLGGSRHLTVDGDTLDARREQPVAPSTPWQQAPPVRISPRLRRTGRHERPGRPRSVTDRSDARALLARQLSADAATRDASMPVPLDTPTLLGHIDARDPAVFARLLEILSDVLAAASPPADGTALGTVRTRSRDGEHELRAEVPSDAAQATVPAPDGTLSGPDLRLTVRRDEGGRP